MVIIDSDVQTDPIMVPFPLPPIGKIHVEEKKVTECVSMQTEYTWIINEFPVRVASTLLFETDKVPATRVTASPKKESGIKRKAVSKPKEIVAPEPEESTESQSMSTSDEVTASQSVSEIETQPVVAAVAPITETPKKRVNRKKIVDETPSPATPATTAAPDTPAASEASVALPRSKSFVSPIMSDSSDDDRPLLSNSVPLTRTITPVAVKPLVGTPSSAKKPERKPVQKAPEPKPVAAPAVSSSAESSDSSSSSDSDNDMPSAAFITGAIKKKGNVSSEEPKQNTNSGSRIGPLAQVSNVSESEIEATRQQMLNMIPEALRKGAIKEAVVDRANNRIIFRLRILPKIVHFLSNSKKVTISGSERPMSILSDKEKRTVVDLFKSSNGHSSSEEQQPPIKRRK